MDLIRKNKQLTICAKEIFGDIVKSAYLTHYDDRKCNGEVNPYSLCSKFLDRFNDYFSYNIEDKKINYDNYGIIVEFINGKTVSFWSSEWGGFMAVNLSEFSEA